MTDLEVRIQAFTWGRSMADGAGYEENADSILEWVGGSTARFDCYKAAFDMGPIKRLSNVLELAKRFATYAESETVAKVPQGGPPRKPGRPKGSKTRKSAGTSRAPSAS